MIIWFGIFIGSFIGSRLAGPVGAIVGAILGYWLEMKWRRAHARKQQRHYATPDMYEQDVRLEQAYRILGVSPMASDEAVRQAYRKKAKIYHPDALRAQGLSEDLIAQATNQMARVNAAWEEIKTARHIT